MPPDNRPTARLRNPSDGMREPGSGRLLAACAASALLGLGCLSAVWWMSAPASAENFPSFEEARRRLQDLNPNPSFDTKPVAVRVVSVEYSIPRNYLTYMPPHIPALTITFPGFKPLTEETQNCFDPKWQRQNPGCTTIEFRLLGSRGPGPGGWAITNAERFENFMRGLKVTVKPAQLGFELYEVGPEEARIRVYRRVEGDIFFDCHSTVYGGRKLTTACNDRFRLDDMNHVQFYFRPQLIEHIPEIEKGIRRLMASFVKRGDSDDVHDVESFDSERNQSGTDGGAGAR